MKTLFALNLFAILFTSGVALAASRALEQSSERIDHLQFEVRTLTHTVGELHGEIQDRR